MIAKRPLARIPAGFTRQRAIIRIPERLRYRYSYISVTGLSDTSVYVFVAWLIALLKMHVMHVYVDFYDS